MFMLLYSEILHHVSVKPNQQFQVGICSPKSHSLEIVISALECGTIIEHKTAMSLSNVL